MIHAGAAIPNLLHASDTHYPWNAASDIVKETDRFRFRDGAIELWEAPGLGVSIDEDRLASAAEAYNQRGSLLARDDVSAMREARSRLVAAHAEVVIRHSTSSSRVPRSVLATRKVTHRRAGERHYRDDGGMTADTAIGNPLAAVSGGEATTDRIRYVKLSTLTLPLDTPISDAKVLTGRQKPMTEIVLLFAEISTEAGHGGIGFSYSKRAGGPAQYAHAKEVADGLLGEDPNDIGRVTRSCSGPVPRWAAAGSPPKLSRPSTSPCTT